jgi:hypothetical protein
MAALGWLSFQRLQKLQRTGMMRCRRWPAAAAQIVVNGATAAEGCIGTMPSCQKLVPATVIANIRQTPLQRLDRGSELTA